MLTPLLAVHTLVVGHGLFTGRLGGTPTNCPGGDLGEDCAVIHGTREGYSTRLGPGGGLIASLLPSLFLSV